MEYSETRKDEQRAMLLNLLNNQKFTDTMFIIGTEKAEYNANRLFLAMVSPVFEAMLFGQMRESELNSDVIIEDMEAKIFECILNFAYCNDPKIEEGNVLRVYQAADKYQMSTLLNWCDESVRSALSETNVCTLLNEAIHRNQQKIIDNCFEFMRKPLTSSKKIICSDAFKAINIKTMRKILQNNVLDADEDALWTEVVSWAECQSRSEKKVANIANGEDDEKHDDDMEKHGHSRVQMLQSVLDLIRFGIMSGVYFTKHVVPENVLSKDEIIAVFIYFQTPDAGCGKFKTTPRAKYADDCNIEYRVEMSSKHSKAGVLNTYEALISKDLTATCSTDKELEKVSWIKARFGRLVQVRKLNVGPSQITNYRSSQVWGAKFLNGVKVYFEVEGSWKYKGRITTTKEGEIRSFTHSCGSGKFPHTTGIKLETSETHQRLSLGHLQVFGHYA